MRVSSLSDGGVIRLVSGYFVPVWVSRDQYQLPQADKADAKLLARVDASRHARKLPSGSVCVYVAEADGTVLATLTVQKACRPELLRPFLEALIADGKLRPRPAAEAKAKAPATEPTAGPKTAGGRLFVVRSRFDDPAVNRGTSRDRVELTAGEWATLLPPAGAGAGKRWTVPAAVAGKLLRFAYPPLPYWDAKLARVTKAELNARVVSTTDRTAEVWLEGRLELIYPDKGKPTDGKVSAALAGTARIDRDGRGLRSFTLVSRQGTYVWQWQGKAQPKAMSFAVELVP